VNILIFYTTLLIIKKIKRLRGLIFVSSITLLSHSAVNSVHKIFALDIFSHIHTCLTSNNSIKLQTIPGRKETRLSLSDSTHNRVPNLPKTEQERKVTLVICAHMCACSRNSFSLFSRVRARMRLFVIALP
jgi:hypothetical protein